MYINSCERVNFNPRPRINRLCMPNFLFGLLNTVWRFGLYCSLWGREHSILKTLFLNQNISMKSSLAAMKRQRFPAQACRRVRGLFILGLGFQHSHKGSRSRGSRGKANYRKYQCVTSWGISGWHGYSCCSQLVNKCHIL